MPLDERVVYLARSPAARYGRVTESFSAPELAPNAEKTTALATLRQLLRTAGLDSTAYGGESWSPLSELVPAGATVVVKPNWVHHQNQSGGGTDALVTHGDVVAAVLEYLVRASPGHVTVGDAPVQGCDFDVLRAAVAADSIERRFAGRLRGLQIIDFRRKVLASTRVGALARSTARTDAEYVLFDLGRASALEAVSEDSARFRVTMYDPRALGRTHAPGRHQYLIAREVLEADVIVNVPKLKTHKKAGITAALKNVVGINGHKEYLPHHRFGGAARGGDNYPGGSRVKELAEFALDTMNLARSERTRAVFATAARALVGMGLMLGHDTNIDGSWSGNDTVWRTTLDLNRILLYGRVDGTLSPTRVRSVITITDAIIAGEGEGPLAPSPLPLGVMTLATNAAAAEVVHARLLGLDPCRLPVVRRAFDGGPAPLADFRMEDVQLSESGHLVPLTGIPEHGKRARVPRGWRGACELEESS